MSTGWKEGVAKHKVDRQTPAVAEVPGPRPRKNRKQWCRGKVGTEHKPVCRTYAETKPTCLLAKDAGGAFRTADWRILVCTTCGKELDRYYPLNFAGSRWPKKPPPAWVDK